MVHETGPAKDAAALLSLPAVLVVVPGEPEMAHAATAELEALPGAPVEGQVSDCLCGHGESCPRCNPYYRPENDPVALKAEVARLREELGRVKFLSCVRAKIAAMWARTVDTERAAHEQTRAELERWRAAWGGDFGPQTPDEVPVFLRESERVQGQTAACEIAKARARVAELEQSLERMRQSRDRSEHGRIAAESALASARARIEQLETILDENETCTRQLDASLASEREAHQAKALLLEAAQKVQAAEIESARKWAEKCQAAQAELERRTAWFNQQIADLRAEHERKDLRWAVDYDNFNEQWELALRETRARRALWKRLAKSIRKRVWDRTYCRFCDEGVTTEPYETLEEQAKAERARIQRAICLLLDRNAAPEWKVNNALEALTKP